MMMKLASSAALLVAGVEANKFFKLNVKDNYALGEELAKSPTDADALEGAYCAYTWHERQGLTEASTTACDMQHGGCNAPVYVLPKGETKDCCKSDQEKIFKGVWADAKNPKEEEFTSLSQAVSWKTRNVNDKGADNKSPTISMSNGKIFGTAMYNTVVQDTAEMKGLLSYFSMSQFQVRTADIKVADRHYNVLKASFMNNRGETMKQALDNLGEALRTVCKLANKASSSMIWRVAPAAVGAAAAPISRPTDPECDGIVASITDIDIHKLMSASDSTIIAPCRKSFAQVSKRESVPKGDGTIPGGVVKGGVSRFTHTAGIAAGSQRVDRFAAAATAGEWPIAMTMYLPTSAAGLACLNTGGVAAGAALTADQRRTCAFSNISANAAFTDANTYGGFPRAALTHNPSTNGSYYVSQTTYWVTKSGVHLQSSVAFAEAAQQAYNDLYWPECCCGISTCCCFATWMAIGGTLFVTISAAVAMMMCGFCDESEDSTYTETNAGASTEAKAEAPATESKPEVAEPEAESKGCNCCLIVIIAVVAVVVIVGLVYCCSGSNKSEMEEESDEEEQP